MDINGSPPAIGMHHRFCTLAIPDLYLVYILCLLPPEEGPYAPQWLSATFCIFCDVFARMLTSTQLHAPFIGGYFMDEFQWLKT